MYVARMRTADLIHLVGHFDLVHAAYYAAMHLLVTFGAGVVAMRSVSLAATVLAAGLIGPVGHRLTGSAISGTLAGLVFALCPTVDGFAKIARSYGTMPLLVIATVATFVWGVRNTGRRTAWLPYLATLLVTVDVHELSLLLLPSLAMVLALHRVDRTVWRGWALSSAAVVVLASPLLYVSHREDHALSYLQSPGVRGFVAVVYTYCGRTSPGHPPYLMVCSTAIPTDEGAPVAFEDSDEVVHYIGGIFETAFATDGIGDKLAATGIVLLVRSTEPESAFIVDTASRRVIAGDDALEASASMTMSAATQNAYWQGKVNLPVAMARGQIKVSGQVGQLLKLAPLSKPLFAGYVERLIADGRDDLIL